MSFQREIGDIYRLKIPYGSVYTSVFLIKLSGGNLLVDCGATDSDVDGYIVSALKELGLSLGDIRYLVLTHNHEDHGGGLRRVLQLHPKITVIDGVSSLFDGLEIYALPGHTLHCIGVFDRQSGTLIAGDGLQGDGVGEYRCTLESEAEYAKTLDKLHKDESIKNILFSHDYKPWNKDYAFGRAAIESCLNDCKKHIERR